MTGTRSIVVSGRHVPDGIPWKVPEIYRMSQYTRSLSLVQAPNQKFVGVTGATKFIQDQATSASESGNFFASPHIFSQS